MFRYILRRSGFVPRSSVKQKRGGESIVNDKIQLNTEGDSKAKSNALVQMIEEQMLQKLQTSRKQADQGLYRDADEVIADFRMKYGL